MSACHRCRTIEKKPVLNFKVSTYLGIEMSSSFDMAYMKCMCGSCWPTYPNYFNPTLNIKMVFGEKIPKMGTFSDFVTIFFVKCYNKI